MCGSTLDCFAQRPIWAHLDVLSDAGRDAAPFSETLPDFHAVAGDFLPLARRLVLHVAGAFFVEVGLAQVVEQCLSSR